jgi:hypothetical protein
MDATCSSETSVEFQRSYIPEDRPLPNHRCENLKFYRLYKSNRDRNFYNVIYYLRIIYYLELHTRNAL